MIAADATEWPEQNYIGPRSKKPSPVGEIMSIQDGIAQQAETELPELELNKESLHDLDVDGSAVKGGAGIIAVAPIAPQTIANPTIRATIGPGTSV
jgi:hypothetical protein